VGCDLTEGNRDLKKLYVVFTGTGVGELGSDGDTGSGVGIIVNSICKFATFIVFGESLIQLPPGDCAMIGDVCLGIRQENGV
jgi:hypothetical protein